MTANINTAKYKSTNIGYQALTANSGRTLGDRGGDVFNVKDFFTAGDPDWTNAIQSAITTMLTPVSFNQGGTLFFPPGVYGISSKINMSGVAASVGRLQGSGMGATRIVATLPDFMMELSIALGSNGIQEICDLSIMNFATNIGSGALRLIGQNLTLRNLELQGMCCLDCNSNSFDSVAYNLKTVSPGGGNPFGSIGVNGTFSVVGFRTTGGHETCFLLADGPMIISEVGIEECTIGLHLGVRAAWATSCTLSGTTLTIAGGTLYPEPYQGVGNLGNASGFMNPGSRCFIVADNIPYGVSVNVTNQLTSTEIGETHGSGPSFDRPHGRGTYQCVITGGSASFSTPQHISIRNGGNQVYSSSFENIETEGCLRGVVVEAADACHFGPMKITGTANEAGTTTGSGIYSGSNGSGPQCGVYIGGASATCTFQDIHSACNGAQGGFVFDSNFAGGPTFISCASDGTYGPSVTGTAAFIDNGAGAGTYNGAAPGHILTIDGLSAGTTSRGTWLSGAGLPTGANRLVIKDQVGGFTQSQGAGSQFILMKPDGSVPTSLTFAPGNAITVNFGDPWVVTDTSSLYPIPNSIGIGRTSSIATNLGGRAGLRFLNSSNPLITLAFTELPGQFNVPLGANVGDEYWLYDSATAGGTFNAPVIFGSGGNLVKVRCTAAVNFVGSLAAGAGGGPFTSTLTVASITSGGPLVQNMSIGGPNPLFHPISIDPAAFPFSGLSGTGNTGTYRVNSQFGIFGTGSINMTGYLWSVV